MLSYSVSRWRSLGGFRLFSAGGRCRRNGGRPFVLVVDRRLVRRSLVCPPQRVKTASDARKQQPRPAAGRVSYLPRPPAF
jgi:hypothetical protein